MWYLIYTGFFVAAMTTYDVHVTTGDVRGGGTDANVFIVLYGDHSDTGRFYVM